MKSFHNDPKVKRKYLARVRAHAKSDEIIKGTYWEDGKGCAVGCTIHSNKHNAYETELGLPEWLALVEDTIFEGLPLERAKLWPEQFLKSIKVGSDLTKVKYQFMIYILDQCEFDRNKWVDVTNAIEQIKKVHEHAIQTNIWDETMASAARSAAWSAARSAARSAASAARSAAWSAACAAESAAYVKYADKLLELLKAAK